MSAFDVLLIAHSVYILHIKFSGLCNQ